MADTQRSKAYVLASLFQDGQSGGAITANDVRDFAESLAPPFMGVYISSSASTTISVQSTPVKVAGTTTVTNQSSNMDTNSTDNRIRYTGVSPRHMHIVAQCSVSLAAGTNQDIGIHLWHWDDSASSGSFLPESEARTTIASTDVVQITSHGDVQMDTNDYLELWIGNHTNTNNLTVDFAYLFAAGMFM